MKAANCPLFLQTYRKLYAAAHYADFRAGTTEKHIRPAAVLRSFPQASLIASGSDRCDTHHIAPRV